MSDPLALLAEARGVRRALERTVLRVLLTGWCRRAVRRASLFREWFGCAMIYPRHMELPLTAIFLAAKKGERVLDLSSPKLLALHYATLGVDLVAADLEAFFLPDFAAFKEHFGLRCETCTLDATRSIAFPPESFDAVYSISVLEHIPDQGDRVALEHLKAILKPGGRLVITLPVFPTYLEEWVIAKNFGWRGVVGTDGRHFYQRRYDRAAFTARLEAAGMALEDVVLVAERPLEPARVDQSGKVIHNWYLLDKYFPMSVLRKASRGMKALRWLRYLSERIASDRYHYLTTDWDDPNIRQVVARFRKSGGV